MDTRLKILNIVKTDLKIQSPRGGTCAKNGVAVSVIKATAYAISGTVNCAKKAVCGFAVYATLGTEAQIEIDTDVAWVAIMRCVKTAGSGQERRPRNFSSWTKRRNLARKRAKSRVQRTANGQRQLSWMIMMIRQWTKERHKGVWKCLFAFEQFRQ